MLAKVLIPICAYIRTTHITHYVAAGARQLIASIRLDERDRTERTLQYSFPQYFVFFLGGGVDLYAYRTLYRIRHRALHKNTYAVLLLLIAVMKRGPLLPTLNTALASTAARTAEQHSATPALEFPRHTVHARPQTCGREPAAHVCCCAGRKKRLYSHRE